MTLDLVAGNAGARGALAAALRAGTLSHAVLLCAPDGCGRNFAARCLAADYLFPQGGAQAQAVLRGESPEVLLLAGEGKSGQIPVAAVRRVRGEVFYSALSAAGRAVLLRDAHRMAAPAANALLKVLEEPPPGVLFILSAQSAALLPATVVSRCAVYTLAPLGIGECAALIGREWQGDAAMPAMLAALYGGRPGMALAALRSAERLGTARDGIAAAAAMMAGDAYALAVKLAAYEGRAEGDGERRAALLGDTASALAAALRGEASALAAALRGEAAAGLPAGSPAAAARALRLLSDAAERLGANAAPKIVFTALAQRVNNQLTNQLTN